MTLQQIGAKHGTDKNRNAFKGITYLEKYEKYIQHRKDDNLNVLEFGILQGGSVRTWKEYFPCSNIIGIDINPNCKKKEEDRIEIFIGSQGSTEIRNKIAEKYKGLDLIVDDGSHLNVHILESFELYWPLLNDNGVYIIEDVPMCWGDLTHAVKGWPGMKYNNPSVELDNSKIDFNGFLLEKIHEGQNPPLIDGVQYTDIYSIDFSLGSIIFTKKI